MIEVREAELEDIEVVTGLLEAFIKEANLKGFGEYDRNRVIESSARMIQGQGSTIFLADNEDKTLGVLGLFLTSTWFSLALVAQETFWFVSPEGRGNGVGAALLKSAEFWARSQGAQNIIMAANANGTEEVANEAYLSFGYERTETHYRKEL